MGVDHREVPHNQSERVLTKKILKEVIHDAQRKPFEMPCSGLYAPEAAKCPLPCPSFTSGIALELIPPPPTLLKAPALSPGSLSMLRSLRNPWRRRGPG